MFQVAISPEFGIFQWDFSCLFRNRYSKCPEVSSQPFYQHGANQELQAVREVKRQLSKDSVPKISQFQYANTPSCDRGLPFGLRPHFLVAFEQANFSGERYWGSHYPRLTRIKAAWDPDNVFHHCHSVASTAQQCCPF